MQFAQTLPDGGTETRLLAQVFLHNGYPVEVLLQSGADPLGTVLFETGALDRERYTRAQTLRVYGNFRIGELMMQARLLDRAALSEGLRAQARRRLHTVFFLPDVAFQVFSGRHDHGSLGSEALLCEPTRVIYFGVRRAWQDQQLQVEVQALLGQELRMPIGQAMQSARWLPPAEARACELLGRGAWTLPELGVATGLSDRALHALLYSFLVCSLLDVRPPAIGRPQRAVRPAPDAPRPAGFPYQPADEPLPADRSSLPEMGRLIQMQAGTGQTPLPMKSRRRSLALVPIVATSAPGQGAAPGASAPSTLASPSAVGTPPAGPAPAAPRTPPPLRTTLPSGRLPSKS